MDKGLNVAKGSATKGGEKSAGALREPSEGIGDFEATRDVTGESESSNDARNYAELFRDRHEKLRKLIEGSGEHERIPLNHVGAYGGEDVFLTGLVSERRRTKKNDWIVKIEDPTGEATVWVKQGKDLADEVETIVPNEVVGFDVGVPLDLDGGRDPLVWGNEMYRPESEGIEDGNPPGIGGEEPPLAVLISDLHVGSSMSLEDRFERFLEWLNGEGESARRRNLAERVEYVLIAGDFFESVADRAVSPEKRNGRTEAR